MFGKSGDIYTVHENTQIREPSDRIVLVREGFSFWAFIFTIVWLLYQRCWLASLFYVALVIALDQGSKKLGLAPPAIAAIQLGLQFWLGCVANDIRRWTLERRGFREVDVVSGESVLLAERRYYDRHPSAV